MKQQTVRVMLIALGWVSIIVGVIGIFVPLVPTTPLILLAAACFARSSTRFHNWLIAHPYFGNIIKKYQSGLGIERKIRNRAIVIMWMGMTISMLIVFKIWSTVMLTAIGIGVTIYLMRLPVYQDVEIASTEEQEM